MENNIFQQGFRTPGSLTRPTGRDEYNPQSEDQGGERTLQGLCRQADQLFFYMLFQPKQGECVMSTVTTPSTINGVNVDQLGANISAIQGNRELAKFQFRASNTWVHGGHNRTTIKEFYGVGKEDMTRTEPFVLDADEPPVLLGEDHGANPVEFVLHALAACLTTSMVYHAAAQGIKINAVESRLEGDLDLRGFLGLSKDVRPGYQNLRVHFTVNSDAPAEKLRELTKYSPVFDIVTNPVPVAIDVTNSQF
ncbi:MAG: OsmC family protein [Nitrospirales bacterium]